MDAKALVERAVGLLFQHDADLPHDVNERSITHRLAFYIEQELRSTSDELRHLSVDCEYNRHGEDPKRLMGLYDKISPWDTEGITVYPDIVVHERGNDNNNRIVIEVKLWRSSREKQDRDRAKLKGYYEELHYQNAFFVLLDMVTKKHRIEGVDEHRDNEENARPEDASYADAGSSASRSRPPLRRRPRTIVGVAVDDAVPPRRRR